MSKNDLEDNLILYTSQEIDTDNSIYLVKKANVCRYHDHNKQLNAIFSQFKKDCKQKLFIIGNYLYFSLDGAKWYESLTSSSWEWEHIQELIQAIKPLVNDIAYEWGRLD